jgi:mono/diheme cytochrome c family protein/glucose/arabinose dehydrogenase
MWDLLPRMSRSFIRSTLIVLLVSSFAAAAKPFIHGYPGKRSFVSGEEVSFHLSSNVGTVDVGIARLGAEREVVWSKQGIAIKEHPVPKHASSHGCDWPASFSVEIAGSWKSGCYEAWTRSGDSQGNRMFFVVRSSHPGRDARILLQLSTNTYNAYNGWGGFSLYSYWGPKNWNKKHQPGDVLGRRVSFQRPFNGMDRNWELPFIQWAERNGYRFDYAINSDLEFHPEILKPYKLVLSIGHDEYWSAPMRDHLETYIAKGGNVAFFSGNTCCWQVRSEDQGNDMICWKEAFKQDPLYRPEGHPLLSTLWSHHLVKRPENQLTGVGFLRGGFHRFRDGIPDGSGAYKVHRPDHWVFQGTGLQEGMEFGGANTIVGYECDGCEFTMVDGRPVPTGRDGTPKDFTILGTAPARWSEGDLGWYKPAHDLWKKNEHEHGCMGIYTVPGGGTVFTAATTDWAHGLAPNPDQAGAAKAIGPLGPGHAVGVFKGETWNVLTNHFTGAVLDEDGKRLPHKLTIEFGASDRNSPITNWGKAPQATYVNAKAPEGVGQSALMSDMLYSYGVPREQGGVRVQGLPAGEYEVFALLRHLFAPESKRYAWAIGIDLNQAEGNSFVATGASRSKWVQATSDQAGNYARAKVQLTGRQDALTMIYDNLDENFTEVMGFQIARIGEPESSFRIQFDCGGPSKSDNHVARITRNVLNKLSGEAPPEQSEPQATGAVPNERPAIRPASALHGWADWDRGKKIFDKIEVPPAPVLSPEDQLKTFKTAAGYQIELVAAEPMIADPVFFEFDADGRMWVLEYRGYMRDLAGSGEGDPICRLMVLEDTDADGRSDRSTVYLDGLVMPRSFAFVEGGLLLAEPPHLWYCQDTDGDLQCDRKRKVGSYGVAGNPQHTANGLRRGIDNWLHNADWPKRHRFQNGKLIEEDAIHRGQFGVSFDDLGRFYSCHESTAAVMDYMPEEYMRRHPGLLELARRQGGRARFGVGTKISGQAQEVFPIRPTPQITLGGLELRDDGTLRTYTIASGTSVYRGDQFPPDARENLFVPEAGGHLIGRLVLPAGLTPQAKRYYPAGQELLTSSDERFRPINARTGPDGALYIADMYKGVIEHVIFMVPWIADQVKARNLESGNDLGRIWRIVAKDRPISYHSPALSKMKSKELVEVLNHPNGWRRDTAQRLLVDRRALDAIVPLKELVTRGQSHLGVMHALWTLEGLNVLEWQTVLDALRHEHPYVRTTALRVMDKMMTGELRPRAAKAIAALTQEREETDPLVLQQALITLSAAAGPDDYKLLLQLAAKRPDKLGHTAALSGLRGREAECLQAASQPIANLPDDLREQFVRDLSSLLEISGHHTKPPPAVNYESLSLKQVARTNEGAKQYAVLCASCHQLHGSGTPEVAPPLARSEWVTGPPERFAQIVLRGLVGPVTVRGKEWNLHMPGIGGSGAVKDEELAAILTYVRRAWGNAADPIEPSLVAREREASANRTFPWTSAELAGHTEPSGPAPIDPDDTGQFLLPAKTAKLFAGQLRYHPTLDLIGPWVKESDAALWQVNASAAGNYRVVLEYAMDDKNAGNTWQLESDLSALKGMVASTGGFDKFVKKEVGILKLKKGSNRILMRAVQGLKGELIDLRSIRLTPQE